VYAQEEDRIIVNESAILKKGTGERLTGKRLREFLVRLIYVEMLGHDASWGYMKVSCRPGPSVDVAACISACADDNYVHVALNMLLIFLKLQ
jgi:hypothetical protein